MRATLTNSEEDHRIVKLCRAQLGVVSIINSTHKLLMVSSHFSCENSPHLKKSSLGPKLENSGRSKLVLSVFLEFQNKDLMTFSFYPSPSFTFIPLILSL